MITPLICCLEQVERASLRGINLHSIYDLRDEVRPKHDGVRDCLANGLPTCTIEVPMTSLARTEANRRNAQKSTGPKSVEGKARSRMNALKHGLCAETVTLPTEYAQAYEDHIGAWMNDWKPPTETRRFLVERAAVAAWRLNRCVRVESTRLSARVHEAFHVWDTARSVDIDLHVNLFPMRPANSINKLEQTQGGIQRLIHLWLNVKDAIEEPDGWYDEVAHHERFVNLMGYTLKDTSKEGCAIIQVSRKLLIRNRPELMKPGETHWDDDHIRRVIETILTTIEGKFTILDQLFSQRPDESAARDLHAERKAFEPRPEDASFQRYEARHEREARSAINLLMKLEKTGEDLAGLEHLETSESEPESEPEAQPEVKAAEAEAKTPGPIEPIATLPVEPTLPISKADRDRASRIWTNVDMLEGSDLPHSI